MASRSDAWSLCPHCDTDVRITVTRQSHPWGSTTAAETLYDHTDLECGCELTDDEIERMIEDAIEPHQEWEHEDC